MGLIDLLTPGRTEAKKTRAALDAADDPQPDPGAIDRLVDMLVDTGLEGRGPLSSAREVAAEALAKSGGDVEKAVARLARQTLLTGGIGGFVTGLGGFVTMPVSLPVNVAEFYLQAVRMVGGIATLRGYDVSEPRVRTAVLLTLVGSDSHEVLEKAGMTTASGRLTSYALKGLPPGALMIINKAVGFRLMRGVSEKVLSRLGRGIPVAGGLVGGGIDGFMMKKMAFLTIHGMGDTEIGYAASLVEAMRARLRDGWEDIEFRSIYYQPFLQPNQFQYFNATRKKV